MENARLMFEKMDTAFTLNICPADTQHWNNVDPTLIQRQNVESTLNRRCVNVLCPLGARLIIIKFQQIPCERS